MRLEVRREQKNWNSKQHYLNISASGSIVTSGLGVEFGVEQVHFIVIYYRNISMCSFKLSTVKNINAATFNLYFMTNTSIITPIYQLNA